MGENILYYFEYTMEYGELKELEIKSFEKDKRIMQETEYRIRKGIEVSEKDLYPDLVLSKPYTYCIGTMKAVTLVPFFSTVITDLRPLPTPEVFVQRYGMSVEEMCELIRKGRIALRLRTSYLNFTGLDYLDELLEINPPSSQRYRFLFPSLHESLLEEGRNLFRNKKPKNKWWEKEYQDWTIKPSFEEVSAFKFALLGCYTYPNIVRNMVKRLLKRDPGLAYKILHLYSRALVYPRMNSLDGINSLTFRDLQIIREFTGIPKNEIPRLFPIEIGKALIANLSLELPSDFDEILRISPPVWMKAVTSLDDALEKRSESKVMDRGKALANLLAETRSKCKSMKYKKESIAKKIRKSVIAGGLITGIAYFGVSGPLSKCLPEEWIWIIGGILGCTDFLSEKLASTFVKFRKPSHVIYYFELTERLGI